MEKDELRASGANDDTSAPFLAIIREAADKAARGLLTQAMARDYLSAITEAATGEPVQVHTVEGWMKSWLADKSLSRARGTALRYQGFVGAFLESLPERRRQRPLESVSAEDVRAFRDAEIAAGKSAASANLALKTLRSVFNLARRQGIIKINPAEAVDTLTKDTLEKDTFTPADIAKLLKAAKGDWHGAILMGYTTGARLGDIADLQWRNVDLERKRITFTAGKTKRVMELPMHPALHEHLLSLPASDDPASPVFPSLSGKTTAGRNGLSGQFQRILERAKLKGAEIAPAGEKGRTRHSLTFHSLRHTFNSALANAGVSQETRMKLTGHSDVKVNAVYTHHELDALRAAVEKLPALALK